MTEEVQPQPQIAGGADARRAPDEIDIRVLDAQYKPIDSFGEWTSLSVDDAIWERQLAFLEERRSTLGPAELERALDVAVRTAAVDSGAIEGLYETDRGLTYTIAVKEAAWQTAMRQHDERMPDFFQAQLAAYDLASEVAASRQPFTEAWIRRLHEVLCQPQASYKALTPQGWVESPLPKGEYKRQPNHVRQADGSAHAYAPVDLTAAEMHRFVDQLNSTELEIAHPVLQAVYAHYWLVAIHPFADGNGRVARALASVFLRRAAHIPLLIWADQRVEYFDALEAADRGGRQTFVDFVFDRAIDAFTLVSNELGPYPEDQMVALSKVHASYGGLTFQELDDKAAQIVQRIAEIAKAVVDELSAPRGLILRPFSSSGGSPRKIDDPDYRTALGGSLMAGLEMESSAPARASRRLQIEILIARKENARYAFRLDCLTHNVPQLEIRLRDVHPTISQSLAIQMRAWIRRALAEGLAQLTGEAQEARRQAGF